MAEDYYRHKKEEAPREKESLETTKYDTIKELEDELKKRHESKTNVIKGKNTNKYTSEEKAQNLSNIIRDNLLPKLLDKASNAKSDKDFEKIRQKIFLWA